MREQVAKKLEELNDAANQVTLIPLSEDEFPDALGHVRFIETKLSGFRQRTLKEAPDWQTGEDYEIVTTRPNAYSYNVQRIMSELGAEGLGMADLINAGVIELKWKVSKLVTMFEAVGLSIEIEPRELGPDDMTLDGPHIGKYRKPPYSRVVGIGKKETSISRAIAEREADG